MKKNKLKISGGRHGGKVLHSPVGRSIRPTPVRVRRSLFDILGDGIGEGPFLDLFSGSGIMAVEAVLRGAPGAICVDIDHDAIQTIRNNIRSAGVSDHVQVFRGDAGRLLSRLLKKTEFRWIFMDPPYASDLVVSILKQLAESELPDPCTIIAETHFKSLIPERIGDLQPFRKERYGDTVIYFWKRTDKPSREEN